LGEEFKTVEALEWLKKNNNISAFSSDRFGETSNTIEFVENLYRIGAVKVNVGGIWEEPERIEEEGGPYASILLVELPEDPERREKILDIYNMEIKKYELNEGEEFEGVSKNILAFWWD